MSHTSKGKCKVKCSLDVLKQVISQKFPSWVKHMQSSEKLDLTYYNYYGKVETTDNAIVLPGIQHSKVKKIEATPGLGFCDIGFRLADGTVENGTWETQMDNMEVNRKYSDVIEQLTASIAEEKGKEFIRSGIIPGLSITGREETDTAITFSIGGAVDVDEIERVGRRINNPIG